KLLFSLHDRRQISGQFGMDAYCFFHRIRELSWVGGGEHDEWCRSVAPTPLASSEAYSGVRVEQFAGGFIGVGDRLKRSVVIDRAAGEKFFETRVGGRR